MEKYILSIFAVVVAIALIGMIVSEDITGNLFLKNKQKWRRAMHPTKDFRPLTQISRQELTQQISRYDLEQGQTELNQVSNDLRERIKDMESQQESLRNQRQMQSTALQTQDQKTQQMNNQMAAIQKAMMEQREQAVRSVAR